jgi:hypothetical protein
MQYLVSFRLGEVCLNFHSKRRSISGKGKGFD